MLLLDIARAIFGDALRAVARRVDPGGEMLRRMHEADDDAEIDELAKPVVSPEAEAMIAKPTIRIEHGFGDLDDPDRVAKVFGETFERAAKKGRRVVAGGR